MVGSFLLLLLIFSPSVLCQDAEVIIIGAGMAGISALNQLNSNGITDVIVLEATSRMGGRMKKTTLGGQTVELGANWIHEPQDNPLYSKALDLGLSLYQEVASDPPIYCEDSSDCGDNDSRWEAIEEAMDTFSESARCEYTGQSLADALKNNGWEADSDYDKFIESNWYSFNFGTDSISQVSMQHYFMEKTGDDYPSNPAMDNLVTDSNGYESIVQDLATGLTSKIQYAKVVKSIDWNDESLVTINLENGATYTATRVIVATSVGVLKDLEFSPSLPVLKQSALDKMDMGLGQKLFLKFDSKFWNGDFDWKDNTTGKFVHWYDMDQRIPGSKILLTAGSTSPDGENDEAGTLADLMAALNIAFPGVNVPNPSSYVFSEWNNDPYTKGIYSLFPPSFTILDYQWLQQPLNKQVYFAGEYLDWDHSGNVEGAYLSGQRVANEVSKCFTAATCAFIFNGPAVCSNNAYVLDDEDDFSTNLQPLAATLLVLLALLVS